MKRLNDPLYVDYSKKILVRDTPKPSPWTTPILLVVLIVVAFSIGLLWISMTTKAIKPYRPPATMEESSTCTTDQDCANQYPHDPCHGAPARPGDNCQA